MRRMPMNSAALKDYLALIDDLTATKSKRKAAEVNLHQMIHDKYPNLVESEVKELVVEDKWLAQVAADVQGELDHGFPGL